MNSKKNVQSIGADMEDREYVADQIRSLADRVEKQDIKWVWFKVQYNDGMSMTFATKDAPKRPGGFK